jgi:hypothetical protein
MSWLLKGQTIALSVIQGLQKGLICILNFEIVNRENYQSYAFGFDKEVKDTPSVSAVYVYPVDSKTSVNQSKRPLLLNLSLQKTVAISLIKWCRMVK